MAILTEKKKYLQIDSKWPETRKKHEIGETEFLPVAGAGSRRSTDFPLDNVNTSYHTEFHQILTINVALVPKRHYFHKGKKAPKRTGKPTILSPIVCSNIENISMSFSS